MHENKNENATIQLAHGGGGRKMRRLIDEVFLKTFDNSILNNRHDSAILTPSHQRLAFTTDSYVVDPLFFPGGDIGKLAVCGTVNDLAMAGARPAYLSLGLILEEGFLHSELEKVIQSIQREAKKAKVEVVTGDTKVVDRGKGDGLFINTAGIGFIEHDLKIVPQSIRSGDQLILSGDLGRHGVAILSRRQGLEFETALESDCACLHDIVLKMIDAGVSPHCLRDLTRGGLASALNELAQDSGFDFTIEEDSIDVHATVQSACEILGLDPLYVANEGRFIAVVSPAQTSQTLEILKGHPLGQNARVIGRVEATTQGRVVAQNPLGGKRLIDLLSGEQLPRIC